MTSEISFEDAMHKKISSEIRKAELWVEELHNRVGIKVRANMELLYED